jgi:hypothetical protein
MSAVFLEIVAGLSAALLLVYLVYALVCAEEF